MHFFFKLDKQDLNNKIWNDFKIIFFVVVTPIKTILFHTCGQMWSYARTFILTIRIIEIHSSFYLIRSAIFRLLMHEDIDNENKSFKIMHIADRSKNTIEMILFGRLIYFDMALRLFKPACYNHPDIHV